MSDFDDDCEDRKAMLQEIMRRGTSSLGTDVPSEREINRLTEEEFWLFEKMDEERRRKERYKSRLMEEHEVPDWVFPRETEEQIKASLDAESQSNGLVTDKRRRKDVVYTDQLCDYQWMKAHEDGEDISDLSSLRKKKKLADEFATDDGFGGATNMFSSWNEEASDDFMVSNRAESEDFDGGDNNSSWHGNIVTWRTHKRKQSSHGFVSSSSDARGPLS